MDRSLPTRNLVAGAWVAPEPARSIIVRDPADDRIAAEVADAREHDVRAAIDGASTALPAWRATGAHDRAATLRRLLHLMREESEHLARLMTLEQGKPLREARAEIEYAAGFIDWAAEEGRRLNGEILRGPHDKRLVVIRQPIGVCAAITPWNFPSAMITRKLGPALAAGCCIIVKPSELTPLSALALGELCERAGVPAGVVSILATSDAPMFARTVLADPRVRKLSFTGSTEVGKILIEQSARTVCNLSLELGGHAPFLVFDDADLDAAIDGAIRGKFRNAGQSCISPNRFYVHRSIHEAFVQGVSARIASLRVGRGSDEQTDVGPLINDAAVRKVLAQIADARARGATVVVGGGLSEVPACKPRFVQPTLLDHVSSDMLISCEETFGPVIAVRPFDDEREAIELANGTIFGLAAYVYTRDLARATRVCEALEFGVVGLNDPVPSTPLAPFGGMKQSGIGREGGRHVMDAYSEIKFISMAL